MPFSVLCHIVRLAVAALANAALRSASGSYCRKVLEIHVGIIGGNKNLRKPGTVSFSSVFVELLKNTIKSLTPSIVPIVKIISVKENQWTTSVLLPFEHSSRLRLVIWWQIGEMALHLKTAKYLFYEC